MAAADSGGIPTSKAPSAPGSGPRGGGTHSRSPPLGTAQTIPFKSQLATNAEASAMQSPSWLQSFGKALGFFWRAVSGLLAAALILAVRVYQWTLSPLLGRWCRFEPSCSQYFILAVKKYGPFLGTLRGLWRILRCNPWNPGGYDPP